MIPLVEDAASEINDLHGLRNRADYQLDSQDVERPVVVLRIVDTAGTVIHTLDAAFTGPRRPQIQAAIGQVASGQWISLNRLTTTPPSPQSSRRRTGCMPPRSAPPAQKNDTAVAP